MPDQIDLPRVKRNVAKMVQQGAPEADIDAYISHEGTTVDQIKATPVQPVLPPIPGSENLDPAQLPPRNPPMSFGEGMAGVAGNMLNGIPIVGPALVGAGNRISAAKHSLMEGKPYGQALEETQTQGENFNREHPAIANSAAAGGGMGSMLIGGGTTAGAKLLGVTGKNLLTRTLASTGTGGAIGGADAYARGNDPIRGAEIGATFGAIAPTAGQVVGAGFRSMMGRGGRVAVPALEDLRNTADAAFQKVDNSGITLLPKKVDKTINDMLSVATRENIDPTLHADSYAVMRKIVALRGQTPTISRLHQIRQLVADAASSPKPADRRMAGLLMNSLDNNIDTLNAFDVRGQGIADPKAAVTALREGIETWRRMRKGEKIAKIYSDAEIDAGAKYTQSGMENALRKGFSRLAKNPKALRGFSKDEVAAIRKVATGGPLENTARFFGKYAPSSPLALATGQVSGATLGTGLGTLLGEPAIGAGLGVAIPVAGTVARGAATAATMRNARLADEMVRRGTSSPKQPMPMTAEALRRAAQAMALGGPMSLYPPLPFDESSARFPR